jgi:hypothetical protein
MKIQKHSDDCLVEFKTLKPGDVFEMSGDILMVVNNENYNAVCLEENILQDVIRTTKVKLYPKAKLVLG